MQKMGLSSSKEKSKPNTEQVLSPVPISTFSIQEKDSLTMEQYFEIFQDELLLEFMENLDKQEHLKEKEPKK